MIIGFSKLTRIQLSVVYFKLINLGFIELRSVLCSLSSICSLIFHHSWDRKKETVGSALFPLKDTSHVYTLSLDIILQTRLCLPGFVLSSKLLSFSSAVTRFPLFPPTTEIILIMNVVSFVSLKFDLSFSLLLFLTCSHFFYLLFFFLSIIDCTGIEHRM